MTGVCHRCARRPWPLAKLSTGAAGRLESVCRHHRAYPERLRKDPLAPSVLRVCGGVEHLRALLAEKVIAIVGTHSPSNYGKRIAQALARDLAISGVTVAGTEEGIGGAACTTVQEAGGNALVMGTWEIASSAAQCSLAWPASERALALLADLTIVIEASEEDWDAASTEELRSRGATVATVPGPVDSPSSHGSNALIAEGAIVVCDAQDALDALYGVGVQRDRRPRRRRSHKRMMTAGSPTVIGMSPASELAAALTPPPGLESEIVFVLERVRRGEDTLAKLCAGGLACGELTLALTELELLGLLRRAQDGHYLVP